MQENKNEFQYDVIVIGAGASGIGAGTILQNSNISYLILESRLRTGGRLTSVEIDDLRIDLGACWIHSYSNKNPLAKFVESFKVKQNSMSRSCGRKFYDGEIGAEIDDQVLHSSHYYQSTFYNQASKNANQSKEDISVYEGGKKFMENEFPNLNDATRRSTQLLINMKEHYEASSTKELSGRNYEFQEDEGGDYSPVGGYSSLMKKIGKNLNIKLNRRVLTVNRQKNDKVVVTCSNGEVYKCKKIIVSLPLGVLKANKVEFIPKLPKQHQHAIQMLGVGLMNKVILSFKQNFWGSLHWISIACDERGKFPHFYNFSQNGHHILCCFITDDFARKCQQKSDEQIIESLVSLLKNIFKSKNVELREAHVTHWGKDQNSLGSYASFHKGSTPQDCYNLRTPIDKQMWFVGEHCYAQHIGTAHGAMQTGQWAATNLVNIFRQEIMSQPMRMQ